MTSNTKFLQARSWWVRDVNTLQVTSSAPNSGESGPAVSPGEYAARLEQRCEDRVDSTLFPNGRPTFHVHTEPVSDSDGTHWDFTVSATYPAGCQQAQHVAQKLKAGGIDTFDTTVTVLRATME